MCWLDWWMLMVISCAQMVLIHLGTILGGDQRATNAILFRMNFDPWLIQFWDVISFPALCMIHMCSLNCWFIMTDTVSIGSFPKSLFAFNLYIYIYIWVCLKMGYTPNYSHLVGIMIMKTSGCRGLAYFQTHPYSIWMYNPFVLQSISAIRMF